MRRTTSHKSKKVSAILCADFHLREDTPICRVDDFQKAQWKKVDFIRNLQIKYNCPVIHAGDLFNHWKPSPYLLSNTINHIPERFWTIYGNHDLPQHSLNLEKKSGIYTLTSAGVINLLKSAHWGIDLRKDLQPYEVVIENRKILVWHIMTYKGDSPWPGCTDLSAEQVLDKFPQFDLIVTGHNHKCFMEEDGKRILLNPGSLTRQAIDQVEHHPSVFLYYAKTNTVKRIHLPIEKEVMSRAHISVKERRDARIEAFVERLNTEWQKGVSFEENLEHFLANNDIADPVIKVIERAIDNEKN